MDNLGTTARASHRPQPVDNPVDNYLMSAARPERQRRHEQKDAPDRAPKSRTPGMHPMHLMSE